VNISKHFQAWVKQKQNEQKVKKEREEAEKTALEQQKSEKRELAAKNFNRWKSELERRLGEKKATERLKAQKKAEQEKQKKFLEFLTKEKSQIFKRTKTTRSTTNIPILEETRRNKKENTKRTGQKC